MANHCRIQLIYVYASNAEVISKWLNGKNCFFPNKILKIMKKIIFLIFLHMIGRKYKVF